MSGKRRRILLVPETRAGHGSGHLKRCLDLASELGHETATALAGEFSAGQIRLAGRSPDCAVIDMRSASAESWDLVVVDRRTTSIDECSALRKVGPLVGIDAGGAGRLCMSYLIDSLPRAVTDPADAPNEKGPEFLSLPLAAVGGTSKSAGILVTFGGEDAGGLTEECCGALLAILSDRQSDSAAARITAVRGPFFEDGRLRAAPFAAEESSAAIEVLDAPEQLSSLIGSFALVVTSFGLTAFEARAAGVPVIVVSASRYHEALARRAGFRLAGTGSPDAAALTAAVGEWLASGTVAEPAPLDEDYSAERVRAAAEKGSLLRAALERLDPAGATGCPVCGRKENPAVARMVDRSYFRCASCGMLYLENLGNRKVSYTKDYFYSDYEKQYGRTYLDDFANIRRMAVPRLERISRLGGSGALLDVGCAFGPFLVEARSAGYDPFGVDISEEAAAHVREELKIPAVSASIRDFDPEASFGVPRFSVVTLWYVIEHFPDVADILRKLNSMLKPGGVLAFSTPSGSGVSARLHREQFFTQSPSDHFTIWEPRRTASVLERFGFSLREVRVTGHHPERFFQNGPNRLQSGGEQTENKGVNPLLLRATAFVSRSFGLGDTFEVYAVKTGEHIS